MWKKFNVLKSPQEIVDESLEMFIDTDTDLTDKKPSEIGKKDNFISLYELGISSSIEIDYPTVTFKYKIEDLSDEDGTITLKIIASITSEYEKTKIIIISGYKTSKIEQNILIENILQLIFNSETFYKNKMSGELIEENDEFTPKNLGFKKFLIKDMDDLELKYILKEYDNVHGTITLSVEVKLKNVKREKIIKIFGYKTLATYSREVINIFLTNLNSQRTTKPFLLPSDLQDEIINFDNLGIQKPLTSNVDCCNLYALQFDDKKGFIQVMVIIEKNNEKGNKELKIDGFKTIMQQNAKILDDIKKYMSNVSETAEAKIQTSKSDFLPSQIGNENDLVSTESLGANYFNDEKLLKLFANILSAYKDQEKKLQKFNDIKKRLIIKHKIDKIDDSLGTICVEAEITFVDNPKSKKVNYQIEGYKTLNQAYLDELNQFIKIIVSPQSTKLTNKIANWEINQIISLEDLGISFPQIVQNVSFINKIEKNDSEKGIVEIEIKLTKGTQFVNKKLQIINFKKLNEQNLEDIKKILPLYRDLFTSKSDCLPRNISIGEKTRLELGISEIDAKLLNGVVVEKYEVKVLDEISGKLGVEITLKKGNSRISEVILIKNYRTLEKQNEVDVSTVKNSFIKNQKTKNTDIFPNNWSSSTFLNFEKLGIVEPTDLLNTVITYTLLENKLDGFLKVTATINKDQATEQFDLIVSGFKTQKMQTLENITKMANQFSNQLTTKSDILPSLFNETIINNQTLGIIGVENPENYPITYTIKSRSDINGIIQVEITVSEKTINKQTINNIQNQEEEKKQIISQTKTITISNFKTTNMQNRDDVEEIIKQLNNLETTIKNKLPSDIEYDFLTTQVLGINPISNPKNTEITYSKVAIDDAKGEFKLKVMVKKGLYTQEKIIIINKFKTQGQLEDDILGVFDAQIPEEIKTDHDNKLPSEI